MIAAFIIVFLIGVISLSAALIMVRANRHEMEGRVNLVATNVVQPSSVSALPPQPPIVRATAEAHKIFGFGVGHSWGMKASAVRLAIFGLSAFLLVFILLYLILHFSIWITLVMALAALWLLPHMILRMEQRKAEAQFVDLFADAVDMVVRMLRAGLPVTAAVRATGIDGPPPVNEVFATLGDQVEIGIPFDEALMITSERVGLPDFRFFAAAVSLQRATGGNLAATLETLSEIIRKRRTARMKARAVTAEVRATAYILAALPFVVIFGLLILNPRYLAPLIDDPRGNIIIGSAAGLLLLAFATMREMMRRAIRL